MSKKTNETQSIDYESLDNLIDRARSSALLKAIERIESGKASDGLLQTFLKGVMPETRLEMDVKEKTLSLMDAKMDKIKSEITTEQMWTDAMAAFARYSGNPEQVVDEDEILP